MFSWLLRTTLPVGCFAMFCFGQGIEMRSRPRRSLRSSRECASLRLIAREQLFVLCDDHRPQRVSVWRPWAEYAMNSAPMRAEPHK